MQNKNESKLQIELEALKKENVLLRKKLDKTLLLETKFNSLLESTRDVVIIVDNEGICLEVMPKDTFIFKQLGYKLSGKNISEFLPVDKTRLMLQSIQETIKIKLPVRFEFDIIKNDATIWISATASPLSSDTAMLVLQDVTQLKKIEESLNYREELYKVLFNNIPLGICISNMQRKIESCNNELINMLGYSKDELKEITINDLYVSPDDSDMVTETLIKNGSVTIFNTQFKRKDDTIIDVILNVSPLPGKNERFFQSTIVDVTSFKRAGEALYESEKRFKTLSEASFEGIAFIQDGIFVDANNQLAEMLGYKVEEIKGKAVVDVVSPESRDNIINNIRNKRLDPFEHMALRKDGSKFPVETQSRILQIAGKEFRVTAINDITHRKELEETLRNSEARFRLLIQNSTDSVSILDEEGRIRFISPSIEKITGYTCYELTGKKFDQLCHPDDISKVENAFNELIIKPDINPQVEFRYKHKNGGYVHVESVGQNLLSDPVINGFVINTRNITERMKMQDALDEERNLLRKVIDSLPMFITCVDKNGNCIVANKQISEYIGIPREEIEGKHYKDFLPWKIKEDRINIFERCLNGEIVYFDDEDINPKSGSIYVHGVVAPLKNKKDEVIGFVMGGMDVTSLRETENALRDSEERYQTFVSNSFEGIWRIESEQPVSISTPVEEQIELLQNCTFVAESNERFAQMGLANNSADLVGKRLSDFMESTGITDVNIFRDFVNSGYHLEDFETSLIDKSSEKRYFTTTFFGIVKDGLLLRTWGVTKDITERKKATEEIERKNVELKELNGTKDRFFSIVAHDLRSPFQGLLGISGILSDPDNSFTMDEMRRFAVQLNTLLKNQFSFLQNLLEWSRIQIGKYECVPDSINLYSIVFDTLELLTGNAEKKSIKLVNDVDSYLFVMADKNMLRAILHNIVTNAIKFTNKNGLIIVSCRIKENNFAEISIKDNGVGINKEILAKLFSLEANYSTKGTEGEKGTGLGMLLCKEMVEKHGGHLEIISEVNQGTDVRFSLQLATETVLQPA
jgi:PAS domain S-box-containing protein